MIIIILYIIHFVLSLTSNCFLNCKYAVCELHSQISELKDDKCILDDKLMEAKDMIVQLKSTVKLLEEKLCKAERELNEMNDQHVNENRTISRLEQPSETIGELMERNAQDVNINRAMFFSKLKKKSTILKDEGANLNRGKP